MGTGKGFVDMEQINILAAEEQESEDPFEAGTGKGREESSQRLKSAGFGGLTWVGLGLFFLIKQKRSHF